MTDAKLLASPSQGHGLTDRLTDPIYNMLTNGEPAGQIVAIVVLDPVKASQRKTAEGLHRDVGFEVIKCEPILDINEANDLRYTLQSLYEARTSRHGQATLPIFYPGQKDKEKAFALMERIEAWADTEGMTGGELEAKWRDMFGIGVKETQSINNVPGDYRKSPPAWLLQFALEVGAIKQDDKPTDADEPAEADGDAAADGDD